MPTRYKSKYTGAIYDTKAAAMRDNWLYLNNPGFRVIVKQNAVKQNSELELPFIKEKKITLSNAGLATGAILSTNMLDSIDKYANKVGLPVKTALGLATKESTLGNPTNDRSTHKIIKPENRKYFQYFGQHINKYNDAVDSRFLINYYKDKDNPYTVLLNAARNSKDYKGTLLRGERYADKLAKQKQGREKTNVLEAGFRFYKEHPDQYNPGQPNYQQLVNKRAEEVWHSPEIQNWYKTYRKRSLEEGGK